MFCDNQLALSTASLQECQSRTSKRICSRALGILSICRSSFTHNYRRAVILRSAPSREGVYGLTKRCVLINGRCEPAARCIFFGLSLPCRLSHNTTTAVFNDQSCPWVHFIMCDPTRPNTTNNGTYSLVVTHFYTYNSSCTSSQPSILPHVLYCHYTY